MLLWLLNTFVISLLFLPISKRLNAVGISKIVGLIITTYVVWLLSFKIDFLHSTLYGFLLIFAFCLLVWLWDFKNLSIYDFFELLKFETVFLVFFLIYTAYEMYNPYAFGAEKMTDMAILTAVTKSDHFPPYDPFLSGYRLDFYYYVGYVTYAFLTLLSFTTTHISYNLACATVFSLTTTSLIYLVSRFREKSLVPLLFFSGNLMTLRMLIQGNVKGAFDFWTVTRVIKGTINEFPLATLFFRDLHPHFMSIPLQVTFLVLLYIWIKEERKSIPVFLSFLLGFMFTVNSWDFFTYMFLYVLTSVVFKRFYALLFLPLSILPFLPFHLNLKSSAVNGVGIVTRRSDLISFVTAQPLVLLPFTYSIVRDRKVFLPALMISIPLAYLLNFQVLIVTLPTIAVFLRKLYEDRNFEDLTVLTALLLLTGVEIFYVNDAYGGEIERLNTVFKSYVQAWILLSFGSVWVKKKAWKALTLILIAILWIYPVGCAFGVTTLGYKGTLDSIEFTKSYGEYNALKYLYGFKGVVVEYPGSNPYESYTYAGRVSAYTGLRSVLSNGGHELFWRFFNNDTVRVLNERWRDIKDIYESKTLRYDLLKKYNVTYIYVGYLEKKYYNVSYGKFSELPKVYDDGNVVVYKVIYPRD